MAEKKLSYYFWEKEIIKSDPERKESLERQYPKIIQGRYKNKPVPFIFTKEFLQSTSSQWQEYGKLSGVELIKTGDELTETIFKDFLESYMMEIPMGYISYKSNNIIKLMLFHADEGRKISYKKEKQESSDDQLLQGQSIKNKLSYMPKGLFSRLYRFIVEIPAEDVLDRLKIEDPAYYNKLINDAKEGKLEKYRFPYTLKKVIKRYSDVV